MSNVPLMIFDPRDRSDKPYPSEAKQFREYHGLDAWLYNPYTGTKRDTRDIGSDPVGAGIVVQPMETKNDDRGEEK